MSEHTERLETGIAAAVRQIDELTAEVRQLADENEFLDSALEMNIMHAHKWKQRALEAEAKLERTDEAAESLRNVITTSSLDWGSARDIAWVYGIVVGWDSDPEDDDDLDAMSELAERFGWSPERVERLRNLRVGFSGGDR